MIPPNSLTWASRILIGLAACSNMLLAQDVQLISDNGVDEDWNTAAAWDNGSPPEVGMNYQADGRLLRSPAANDPVFAGASLTLTGPNASLVLQHTGAAEVNGFAFTDSLITSTTDQVLAGDALTVAGTNGILLQNGDMLEIQSPLRGDGSVEMLGVFNDADGSIAGTLRLSGAGSDHGIDWIVREATLHAVAPGAIGGNVRLIRGRLDVDYHLSAPESVLTFDGDGFHLVLDHTLIFQGVEIEVNGTLVLALDPGIYSSNTLIDIGFTEELVSGDGTLVVLDETLDSDGDGLLDDWERAQLGDLSGTRLGDADGDGLSNVDEFALATNPQNADTDGDGLADGAETNSGVFVSADNAGSDPKVSDTDGDGLGDGDEVNQHQTSPVTADTDGDGLTDPAEINDHGTSPNKADSDDDGNDDRSELLVGTDPNDAESSFSLVEIGNVRFEEAPLGASQHVGDQELGWEVAVAAGSPQTVDTLDGTALKDRQLLLHNGAMIWQSDVIPLGGFAAATVSFDARIYQTSSGIESDDFMDFKILTSTDGGQTFGGEVIVAQYEGTRTGAGGGGRLPLEDVFDINAAADGPWVSVRSAFGDIPPGVTHIRVVIDASNNSNSERFLFDNIKVEAVALVALDADSDGDGLPDIVEIQNGLDPENAGDAAEDSDDDGLTNLEEHAAGTFMQLADSDGDGLNDGDELNQHQTDPKRRDSDGDSLTDGLEVNTYATDPNNADTDGDSYSDALEIRFDRNPNVADTTPPFGPPQSLGFTWFEESPLGAVAFAGGENAIELGWIMGGQGTDGGVIDMLDGVALPTNQLYIHNGSLTFISDPIEVPNPEITVVTVDARVYQTSSGIENDDFIDVIVEASTDGGETFIEAFRLLSVEGTRTGATDGGTRTPLEDVFAINAPADGAFVTLSSDRGQLPAGVTHVRVIIDAMNNSNSERFIFDNIAVFERPVFPDGQDSDEDGMPDGWEFDNGFDRLSAADAALDADGDGLTNLEEFERDTFPRTTDSDGDGLADGQEVTESLTNPLSEDTDGDGLADGMELTDNLSDPLLTDTDGDGFNDGLEVAFGQDPRVANPDGKLGPEGALAFTAFEQAAPGTATAFEDQGIEIGWQAEVTGDTSVVDEVAGVPLPNQAYLMHNGSLTLITDPIAIESPSTTTVSIDARVYQESTGIESDDFIDFTIEASDDGVTFTAVATFLAIEGTRTGPSGGDRTPLEDVLEIDITEATAVGPFVTFRSSPGAIPEGATHIRVRIDALNNSDSEHFLFDNLVVRGDAPPPTPSPTRPAVLEIRHDSAQGVLLEWQSENGSVDKLEFSETLEQANWQEIAAIQGDGNLSAFTHVEVQRGRAGYYRVVRTDSE